MQNGHQESQSQQSQNGMISRPTIRRKSSAGLLSSFKAPVPVPASGSAFANTAGSIPATASQLQLQQPPSQLPPTPPVSGTISTTSSSMASTSRDWDTVSLHSESASGNAAYIQPYQSTSIEYLRDVVQKRIMTLTYIRNAHEGKRHWFHTILLTRAELDKVFHNIAMRKHTYRFAILALSLSGAFEIPTAIDFLRGVLLTLSEFDQLQDDNFKPKMAFPLDYHETLLSLLDILSEIYQKISRILGPSQFQSGTTMHMMAPFGLLSPHPGVSSVFSGTDGLQAEIDPTLWGSVFGNSTNIALGSPPTPWTVPMGDMFMKIDGKLKKLISSLVKELDLLARDSIRDELASLDPLLRNVKEGPLKELHYEVDSNL